MTTVLIAGGGTGGHVYPALAIADVLKKASGTRVVFAGTATGLESRVIPQAGYDLVCLRVEPMRGGGVLRFARGAWVAFGALFESAAVVRRIKPDVILSVGGYAAGPIGLAGALMGVPLALYEPNGVAGFTNRLLSPFAKRAYVTWDSVHRSFKKGTARTFGVPLRESFFAAVPETTQRPGISILVLGGSQGAKVFNEQFPAILSRAAGAADVRVVHQSGRDRDVPVRERYQELGFEDASVVPFIEDVPSAIRNADIVVARAGASSVAEITSIGRATIFVPYPFAADDHQTKNAEALRDLGGCLVVAEKQIGTLEGRLRDLIRDAALRASLAAKSRAAGRTDSAAKIAEDLLSIANPNAQADLLCATENS